MLKGDDTVRLAILVSGTISALLMFLIFKDEYVTDCEILPDPIITIDTVYIQDTIYVVEKLDRESKKNALTIHESIAEMLSHKKNSKEDWEN